MMRSLALVLSLAGFTALAFAMTRTQRDVLGQRLSGSRNWTLRAAGTILLLLALSVLVRWQGWALGLAMYSGHTSLAAGLVHASLIAAARRRARSVRA